MCSRQSSPTVEQCCCCASHGLNLASSTNRLRGIVCIAAFLTQSQLPPVLVGNRQPNYSRRSILGREERKEETPMAAAGSSAAWKRWLRPEVYPIFAATGVAVSICAMQLIRNITTNPEVRVTKENRAAGIQENFDEGKRYSQHGFRKFIDRQRPEIMPAINNFFSDPPKY
ncbi:hypothetical protein CFC21_021745 [Triticum aestivum]|uniref:B12D-like protein n=8 Tax=Triticinae TaxID=1648030 RepID=A0A3B6C078_WHEAT|nr:uncharacterized protein LOC123040627 [Triticum aestivum]KAF7006738.1 hypothetical protein CFC21_021745 [Triticum aestivum]